MIIPYRYLKAAPLNQRLAQEKKIALILKGFSVLSLVLGLVLVSNAALPILYYELTNVRFTSRWLSPLSSQGVILGEEAMVDYSNPKSWFPEVSPLPTRPSKITHYNLSIPKLKIENAVVQIGGEDLMKSLIHYPGTALPGLYGNAVIFGHSVLPQFFNPQHYKTIFSTLDRLEEGDEILVDFDGIQYRYLVRKLFETEPEDVTILEQRSNSQWLSLVTCVPPGTYLRRLIVHAQLASR